MGSRGGARTLLAIRRACLSFARKQLRSSLARSAWSRSGKVKDEAAISTSREVKGVTKRDILSRREEEGGEERGRQKTTITRRDVTDRQF